MNAPRLRLAEPVTDSPWMLQAACWGSADPDLWFIEERNAVKAALDVCRHCPVAAACLAYALAHDEAGVWGGTTTEQRRRMPSNNRRPTGRPRSSAPCGTSAGYRAHLRHHTPLCEACRRAEKVRKADAR